MSIFNQPNFKQDYRALFDMVEDWPLAKQRETFRKLCVTDMYFLLRYGCQVAPHIIDLPFAVERCREYDERVIAPGGLENWLIMVFRFGFKSTIYNYGASIQKILKYPEDSTCIFSYNKTLAVRHLKQIKETLESSERLQNWFPEILYERVPDKGWSSEEGLYVKRKTTRQEPTLMASGLVSGMPTGMHFNYLCYDDVVTRDSVKTPHGMEETLEAYKNSLSLGITLPGIRSEKWVLGTFYKYNDAYCQMVEEGTYRFDHVPWINTRDEVWYNTQPGEYFVHDPREAEIIIKQFGRYEIATQMLLEPVPKEDRTFDYEKRHTYRLDEIPTDLRFYVCADLACARSEKTGHDPDRTSINVLAKDQFANEYYITGAVDEFTRPEAVDKALDFCKEFDADFLYWEQVAAQEDEYYIKREKARRGGIRAKLVPFKPFGEKDDRIEAAKSFATAGSA